MKFFNTQTFNYYFTINKMSLKADCCILFMLVDGARVQLFVVHSSHKATKTSHGFAFPV